VPAKWRRVVSPPYNIYAGVPPLVGCQLRNSGNVHSCTPYLQIVLFVQNLRTSCGYWDLVNTKLEMPLCHSVVAMRLQLALLVGPCGLHDVCALPSTCCEWLRQSVWNSVCISCDFLNGILHRFLPLACSRIWTLDSHGGDYGECRLLGYKNPLRSYKRYITFPLQYPACKCCVRFEVFTAVTM
jgi:hypothetical protein